MPCEGKDVSKVRIVMVSPSGMCLGQREEVMQDAEIPEW